LIKNTFFYKSDLETFIKIINTDHEQTFNRTYVVHIPTYARRVLGVQRIKKEFGGLVWIAMFVVYSLILLSVNNTYRMRVPLFLIFNVNILKRKSINTIKLNIIYIKLRIM
jgi:hypothetical protein